MFLVIAGNGLEVECETEDAANTAAFQLYQDGEPLPIERYVYSHETGEYVKAIGSYGNIG